jgi:hypothetical protein
MCHNGTDICVSINSLSMSQHLAHGDRLGPCSYVSSSMQSASKKVLPVQDMQFSDEIAKPLEVHPNPSSGRFQLKMDGSKRTEVQVIDANGNVIERRISNGKSLETFDISKRPTGVYYIKTISAEGVHTVKVWLQR